MKVYLIEDEAPAAAFLSALLRELEPGVEILGVADNTVQAVEDLSRLRPDLIMMDIHLGDDVSFSILPQVEIRCPIIFTTAYDQYALQAFKTQSIDYLLKPVRTSDLRKALDKYHAMKSLAMSQVEQLLAQFRPAAPAYRERFLVDDGRQLRSVHVDDIAWFMSEGRYAKLRLHDGPAYLVDDTMEKLEHTLDPHRFFRINRQFLVSYPAIDRITPYSKARLLLSLRPAPPEDAIVSSERLSAFKAWLNR